MILIKWVFRTKWKNLKKSVKVNEYIAYVASQARTVWDGRTAFKALAQSDFIYPYRIIYLVNLRLRLRIVSCILSICDFASDRSIRNLIFQFSIDPSLDFDDSLSPAPSMGGESLIPLFCVAEVSAAVSPSFSFIALCNHDADRPFSLCFLHHRPRGA